MKEFFDSRREYDVFIPDYIARDSVRGCYELANSFLKVNDIHRYKRVHVLASILGGYGLNIMISEDAWPNLARVVYVRSPLQERVPSIISRERPLFLRFFFETVARDLASKRYPAIHAGTFKTGLMIEAKPTPYVVSHQDDVLAAGAVDWSSEQFSGQWAGAIYTTAHHDEIYTDPGISWKPFCSFIESGRFPGDVPRGLPVSEAL